MADFKQLHDEKLKLMQRIAKAKQQIKTDEARLLVVEQGLVQNQEESEAHMKSNQEAMARHAAQSSARGKHP